MNLKKVKDHLYSARWGVVTKKDDLAYEEITKALIEIGGIHPEKGQGDIDPDMTVLPPKEADYQIEKPKITRVSGVSFRKHGNYRTPSGEFKGLVVHHTVSGRTPASAVSVLKYLASQGLGCMVMDENGEIYVPEGFDILKHWGSHAGVSRWANDEGLSDEYAGIEICCWGKDSKVGPFRVVGNEDGMIAGSYQAYTQAQEDALIDFIIWALSVNKEFSIDRVCGHDEARTAAGRRGDKSDPSGSLSMSMPKFRALLKSKAQALGLA